MHSSATTNTKYSLRFFLCALLAATRCTVQKHTVKPNCAQHDSSVHVASYHRTTHDDGQVQTPHQTHKLKQHGTPTKTIHTTKLTTSCTPVPYKESNTATPNTHRQTQKAHDTLYLHNAFSTTKYTHRHTHKHSTQTALSIESRHPPNGDSVKARTHNQSTLLLVHTKSTTDIININIIVRVDSAHSPKRVSGKATTHNAANKKLKYSKSFGESSSRHSRKRASGKARTHNQATLQTKSSYHQKY